jgi:hypothetical protein
MQGPTIAAKTVALCSTDGKSTNAWGLNRYGGEGGIRTHGRVSPTLAFEASSFNRSDTSPQLFWHCNGAETAGQRRLAWHLRELRTRTLLFRWGTQAKRQEGWHTLSIDFVARAEAGR